MTTSRQIAASDITALGFAIQAVVRPSNIPTDGTSDASASINAAVSQIIASKGGVLDIPYCAAGYTLGSSVVIDPGLYANGGAITIRLNGNIFYAPASGFCFDVKTNFFGANNGGKVGSKVVSIEGGGAFILGSSTAAGGVRFTDTVGCTARDMVINGCTNGDAVQLYCSTPGFGSESAFTWVEHNTIERIFGSANKNGIYGKSGADGTSGSFLANTISKCVFEARTNGAKLFNLEGAWFTARIDQCGGYYNQLGATGGAGFYLNGRYRNAVVTSPWIDNGGGGTQSSASDIQFGPLYTGSLDELPLLVNTAWIMLPPTWRAQLLVSGPPLVASGEAGANAPIVLRGNRTLYVSASTGSDSNDGMTAGTAFATISGARDALRGYDANGYNVTLQLADGTYTAATFAGNVRGIGSASLTLQGNTTTPGAVKVNALTVRGGARLNLRGVDLGTTSSGDALTASDTGTYVYLDTGVRFAACNGKHIRITLGAAVEQGAPYTITGNAPTHFEVNGGTFTKGASIDATNIAFSQNFANVYNGGKLMCNDTSFTITGSTGTKFYVYNQGLIQTYGAGTSIFPGGVAGYADTGTFGLYA